MSSTDVGPLGLARPPSTDDRDRGVDAAVRQVRGASAKGDRKALVDASRQLEAVFLGMIFEEMAKTVSSEGGLFPEDPGREMYEQWFRTEVAKQWASGGGSGLGDMIARSVERANGTMNGAEASTPTKNEVRLPPLPFPARSIVPAVNVHAQRHFENPARVSSAYGARIHPVTGRESFHHGVDIAMPEGTPIRAPFSGTVVSVEEGINEGLALTIEHAEGYRSTYAHASRIDVRIGDTVDRGQVIALSGNTGRTTGPHLHFAVNQRGRSLDPSRWISELGIP